MIVSSLCQSSIRSGFMRARAHTGQHTTIEKEREREKKNTRHNILLDFLLLLPSFIAYIVAPHSIWFDSVCVRICLSCMRRCLRCSTRSKVNISLSNETTQSKKNVITIYLLIVSCVRTEQQSKKKSFSSWSIVFVVSSYFECTQFETYTEKPML